MRVRLRRAYDAPARGEGARYLVDRLWPRGVSADDLALDGWIKEVAPSSELRRWFGHDPDRFAEFCERYARELDGKPEAWRPLLQEARERGVTLLYGARDREHNNAVALKRYLETRARHREA